jgi:hypothetical protein
MVRPTSTTLEAIRLTVQQIEQETADENVDPHAVAELKRNLVNRIADLDAAQALPQPESENAEQPTP